MSLVILKGLRSRPILKGYGVTGSGNSYSDARVEALSGAETQSAKIAFLGQMAEAGTGADLLSSLLTLGAGVFETGSATDNFQLGAIVASFDEAGIIIDSADAARIVSAVLTESATLVAIDGVLWDINAARDEAGNAVDHCYVLTAAGEGKPVRIWLHHHPKPRIGRRVERPALPWIGRRPPRRL